MLTCLEFAFNAVQLSEKGKIEKKIIEKIKDNLSITGYINIQLSKILKYEILLV